VYLFDLFDFKKPKKKKLIDDNKRLKEHNKKLSDQLRIKAMQVVQLKKDIKKIRRKTG